MRILIFLSFIQFIYGCTTIEVAKEITKAGSSIQASVKNIISNKSNNKNKEQGVIVDEKIIIQKISVLENEKNKEKELIKKQKSIKNINFIDKTINEITLNIGEPELNKIDGDIKITRHDSEICRLFLFYDIAIKPMRVEYYEIRDVEGILITKTKKVESCYDSLNIF